jgi:hypothetical protein
MLRAYCPECAVAARTRRALRDPTLNPPGSWDTSQYALDLTATLRVIFSDDEPHSWDHGTTLRIRRQ